MESIDLKNLSCGHKAAKRILGKTEHVETVTISGTSEFGKTIDANSTYSFEVGYDGVSRKYSGCKPERVGEDWLFDFTKGIRI